MDKRELQRRLNQPYNPQNWKEIVDFVFPNVSFFSNPVQFDIEDDIIKKFIQIGNIRLNDGKNLALFELLLTDKVNLKRNRVKLNNIISQFIDQDQTHGVLSVFEQGTEDYRFTFSAKSAEFDEEEGGLLQIRTDTKRYTYVLGKNESCRTPADRFFQLSNEKLHADIKTVQKAFSVDKLSYEFFKKYTFQFEKFWSYLNQHKNYRTLFRDETDEKTERNIRDYVKKLLGRIVFMYFIQKKAWIGCSPDNILWRDGDKSFMKHLFESFTNKEAFNSKCLSVLFYSTLNKKRKNDIFRCEGLEGSLNGSRIPYINGGLFEGDKSISKKLDFPVDYFEDLIDFFEQFNFTIDENSPEENEVGIDPEMLGHIFENLIEDNREKGTFYTPKKVVQYMCQESIIEYLDGKINTHKKPQIRHALENVVRLNLFEQSIDHDILKLISEQLYKVKICDPSIGSGAFPIGILNIIYRIIEEIYYKQPDSISQIWNTCETEWEPNNIKKKIIQNSIYGVDIMSGAVDIARLRFWLSLIVVEEEPIPLPNLDYKIMQGDSLLESFEGIDLSNVSDIKIEEVIENNQIDIFTGEPQKKVNALLNFEDIQEYIKFYFDENDPEQKKSIHKKIDDEILSQLKTTIILNINDLKSKLDFLKKNIIEGRKKQKNIYDQTKKELVSYDEKERNLRKLISSQERPFFLWHLYFKDIFEMGGFDIVIGNPPYGVSIQDNYRKAVISELGKVPDYEIYYFFIELSKKLLKNNGILCYITPNTFLFNTYAAKYRIHLLKSWNIVEILDCTKFKIFKNATVRNCIILFKQSTGVKIGYKKTREIKSFEELITQSRFLIEKEDLLSLNQNWGLAFLLQPQIIQLVSKIKLKGNDLQLYFPEISQGLIAYDIYTGQDPSIIENRAYHYNELVKSDLKKWLWGKDVTRYKVEWNHQEYIDYCDGIANPREQKYFVSPRIIVREITNPRIFAAYTNEELYNDPAIINVLDNETYDIKYVLGILNSKLATFFHFNYSPKATKGDFPKILVKDIKEFPIPSNFNSNPRIKKLIDNKIESEKTNKDLLNFERIIDTWVYKLYELDFDEVLIIEPDFHLSRKDYSDFTID
jgi:hypothetical protein